MQDVVNDLQKLDLTDGEAKVYLALLEIGPNTVGPIVKRSKVAYSNIYEILQRLMEKGIVNFIIKNNVRHFQPVDPKLLYEYMEKKEEELEKQKQSLKLIIPRLEAHHLTKPKEDARVYIGFKGLKSAYHDFLSNTKKGDKNNITYIDRKEYTEEADRFYLQYIPMIKNLDVRLISNQEYRKSKLAKSKSPIKIKYVNFPMFSHAESVTDKLLLVSWEKPVMATLIHSKNLVENFNEYFKDLWKVAKV